MSSNEINRSRKVQYLAGTTAALSMIYTGAVQAWPSPVIPKFRSGETNVDITDAQISWAVSLFPLGAIIGCYIGPLLSERIGRKYTILSSVLPAVISSLIVIFARIPELLYAARIIIGTSTGIVAVIAIVYIAEISDRDIRGSLGTLAQVMMNMGSLIVYGIGPFISYTFINCIILCLALVCILASFWIPETPYYYLKEENYEAAKKNFKLLKGTDDDKWVDEQLGIIKEHVTRSMQDKTTYKELFTNKKYRRPVIVVGGMKMLQYMTGSLAIQAYLEIIFRQSSSISGPLASIIYGVVQVATGVLTTFLTAWFGRRALTLASCAGVGASYSLVGAYFYLQDEARLSPERLHALSALPALGIFGFNVFYSVGLGTVPYLLQGELFPMNVKVVASSAATMSACVFSFITMKGYQTIKDYVGHYAVFWTFGAFGFFGLVFTYLIVPETKGKSLEEVQQRMEGKLPEAIALRTRDEK